MIDVILVGGPGAGMIVRATQGQEYVFTSCLTETDILEFRYKLVKEARFSFAFSSRIRPMYVPDDVPEAQIAEFVLESLQQRYRPLRPLTQKQVEKLLAESTERG